MRSPHRSQHAIVIGASLAGLLAGRVLADYFEQVTILERDRLDVGAEARKGVPQGRHGHVLLAKGVSLLDDLFPDLFTTLVQHGSTVLDTIQQVHWYHFGVWKAQFPSAITIYSQSRPFLEQQVRERLATRPAIRFLDGCEVRGLCATEDTTRITGVRFAPAGGTSVEEELRADLVVDASGRGSQTPQWLQVLGYGPVEVTQIKVDVGYASRIYRRRNEHPQPPHLLAVSPTPPEGKRAGYLFPIEGGRWLVSLAGWLRDYPPGDEAGFLDYARSLPVPDLFEAITAADPLTPIATHRFPANQRRHYERLAHFPHGLLVLGDAFCSFNPVYGQGMTTAALDAQVLRACLHHQQRRGSPGDVVGLARRFHTRIARTVDAPWQLATSEDFRFPETQGQRPLGIRFLNWYTRRVHYLVASHRYVTVRFYEVLHLLKPPLALFDPRIVLAVFFAARSPHSGHTVLRREDTA